MVAYFSSSELWRTAVRPWIHPCLQVGFEHCERIFCEEYSPAVHSSLIQEATLIEVDNLRQQIYRIKGENTVSPVPCLRANLAY